MPQNYVNLLGPNGEVNIGGTKQYFLWAPKEDFDAIQTITPTPASMADRVEITGTHTFQVGRGFAKIYTTLNMGELNAETQGEFDGKSIRPVATGFYPGDDAEALGTFDQMNHQQGIVLIPLLKPDTTPKYIQIGIEDLWANVRTNFRSGKNGEGVKGTEISIETFAPQLLIYSGTANILA